MSSRKVLSCTVALVLAAAVSGQGCAPHAFGGHSAQLKMVSHQLRGEVSIADTCDFAVSQFEMLPGPSVYWWVAKGTSLSDMLEGKRAVGSRLDAMYNGTMLTFRLEPDVKWEDWSVLAVWDEASRSAYGYITLERGEGDGLAEAALEHTHFDGCYEPSQNSRIRWSLVSSDGGAPTHIDMAIEHTHPQNTWTSLAVVNPSLPEQETRTMVTADAVMTGYYDGKPYAIDYYLGSTDECFTNDKNESFGVCSDVALGGTNDVQLVYAHYLEGVTLVRFRRPLVSEDKAFDHDLPSSGGARLIWAHAQLDEPGSMSMRAARGTRNSVYPLTHGGEPSNYGEHSVALHAKGMGCSPLKGLGESTGAGAVGRVTADAAAGQKIVLQVTAGPTSPGHPAPPAPPASLYINGIPTPVIHAAEGTTIVFEIMAGEENPFYLSTSPLGGAFNTEILERLVAGPITGVAGTPERPAYLEWVVSMDEGESVYYNSRNAIKMGWVIEVEPALSSQYDNQVVLGGGGATIHWTLDETAGSVDIAVAAHIRSNWLSWAIGTGMEDGLSYVAWLDESGAARMEAYCLAGKTAQNVLRTYEVLDDWEVAQINGRITMRIKRGLRPNAPDPEGCGGWGVINPAADVPILWAVGESWHAGGDEGPPLESVDTHSDRSGVATLVGLRSGASKQAKLSSLLFWHGLAMFAAWGVLGPVTAIAASALKSTPGITPGKHELENLLQKKKVLSKPVWLGGHMVLAYATLAATIIGYATIWMWVEDENAGIHWGSDHNYIGTAVVVIAVLQPLNGYFRADNPPPGQPKALRRVAWEYGHRILGVAALVLGAAAVFTGLDEVERFGSGDNKTLYGLCFVWGGVLVLAKVAFDLRRDRLAMVAYHKVRCMAPDVVDACIDLLEITKRDTVLDLGCGDGRCLIAAAKKKGARGIGYEIEPERADEAKALVKEAGVEKMVTIYEKNALEASLAGVTTVILYLTTRGMKLVLPMIEAAPQPLRVAAFWFPFPGMKPDKVAKLEHTTGGERIKSPMYVYHFPGSAAADVEGGASASRGLPSMAAKGKEEGQGKKWLAMLGVAGLVLAGALGQFSSSKGKGGKGKAAREVGAKQRRRGSIDKGEDLSKAKGKGKGKGKRR